MEREMLNELPFSADELEPHLEFKSHDLVPGVVFKAAVDANKLKKLLYSKDYKNWVTFFTWPGALAASSFIATNPSVVKDKFVFDLACGGGLIGLTAKKYGASESVCIDISAMSEYFIEENCKANNIKVEYIKKSVLELNEIAIPKNSVFFCSEIDFPHKDNTEILKILSKLSKMGYPVFTTHTMRENPPFNFNDFTRGITRFNIVGKYLVSAPSLNMEAKSFLKTLVVKLAP